MPSNGEGRAPRQRPGPAPTTTTESLPHRGDPQRIGELLNDWLAIQMDRVDSLTAEAESKVAAIPDQRHLWLMLGETLVRLHCVELELAELKRGRGDDLPVGR